MNEQIEAILKDLNFTQLAGLGSLAFLALREQTSLVHQWSEWGYTDIPLGAIQMCEAVDPGLMELIEATAAFTLEAITSHAKPE